MRRERRSFGREQTDFKRILYIAGGILSLSIIAFIAIFILYGTGNEEKAQIAKFNTSMADEYSSNAIEETSTQMGKTVNELQENDLNAENKITNEISNELNENDTKYAINTSKSEDKTIEKVKEDNIKEGNSNEEKKDEKVKDPEFTMPVEGNILKEYAKDQLVYSATLDEWITHNGIDIEAEKTTVVKASAEGTIKSIKNDPRYGLTVVIEHVNGFSSVYSNLLTAEFVEEGEKIKQGQTIGTIGNTATFEIADESHLHFEILKDNVNVDPELYVN